MFLEKKDKTKIMREAYYEARHLACLEKGDEKRALEFLKKLEELN